MRRGEKRRREVSWVLERIPHKLYFRRYEMVFVQLKIYFVLKVV
jgi:hypothetical protein